MKVRQWATEYGSAVGLTVFFAIVLGQLPLFRETFVGKLRASDLVQFLGYGGALTIAWLGARQLANDFPEEWKSMAPFLALLLPLATPVTTALSYSVLLLICEPFLSKAAKGMYRWVFISGIVGSVGWFLFAWIWKCAPLIAAMDSRKCGKPPSWIRTPAASIEVQPTHHCKLFKNSTTRFSPQYGSSPFRLH